MEHTVKREYNYTFGILTALAIIFVVAGHLNYNILTVEGLFPYYSFHMPLFMFISGYFYKEEYENQVGAFLLRKIKRLVIPYFIWNIFYGILVLILRKFGFTIGNDVNLYTLIVQPVVDGHQFYFNLAAWFLLALFIVEVIYLFGQKVIHFLFKNKVFGLGLMFVMSLVGGIIAIKMANKGYNYSFWLIMIRTLFFIPFYCLGNMYKTFLEKKDNLNNFLYFVLVMGGAVFNYDALWMGSDIQCSFWSVFLESCYAIFNSGFRNCILVKNCQDDYSNCEEGWMAYLFG